jgi:hypothetical protein
VSEPDKALRRFVAAEHGLDWRAANLLQGATVDELERSAEKLANLIGSHREEEEEPAPTDIFRAARQATAERKHGLGMLLSGREQPRDTIGRYSKPADGFSGGARQPVPRRETHEQFLADALADGRADVGARF